MRRILLRSAIAVAFVAAGGCSWTTGGGGPLDPQHRAALVEGFLGGVPQPGALFASDAPVRFVLEADFHLLDGDRTLDSEERPARVILAGPEGGVVEVPVQVPVEIPVEVRTRGRYRLRPSTCPFPPLRLDFPSSELHGTLFDGQDKLKLVTHCRNRGDYEQNVLEEYLAYRLYNVLTEVSFKVQLAEITYLDTSGHNRPMTRMAFLIEDDDALAERLGGEVLDVPGLEAGVLDPGELGLMYTFQYMIGNTDWSTEGGHNMAFLRAGPSIFAVPYDFDFSGLVDAPYAGPAPSVADRIRSVRDRLYRGYCVEGVDHEAVLNRFRAARHDLLSLVETQGKLSYRNRLSAERYLEEFFDDLGYPHRVERNIIQACRR